MELRNLYPLIVPADYVTGSGWDLPHHPLSNKSFILTWVQFEPEEAMTYLTRGEYQILQARHPGWQQQSIENLRHSLAETENLYTHVKLSEDGQHILFLAFMHEDGLGSSRLLLATEWTQAFPDGYSLALPDRSCGVLVPHSSTATEIEEVQQLVRSMYQGVTVPMSDQLYARADFALPTSWTTPPDTSFSQAVAESITQFTAT